MLEADYRKRKVKKAEWFKIWRLNTDLGASEMAEDLLLRRISGASLSGEPGCHYADHIQHMSTCLSPNHPSGIRRLERTSTPETAPEVSLLVA